MACPTATAEITRRLLTNWNFGLVNSASYTRHVCATVANRKMKVFKPFLQISGLCQLSLIRICPLTLRKDLPSSSSLMLSKIETTGFDYAETNHLPWTKPCCWPVNLKHFVSWIEIGQEALQRFALLMKFKASMICFKLSLKCYGLTFKHNNDQQVVLQQLVQQLQKLSQSMSVNTSGSQRRPHAPRSFSRNVPCWDCKEFGHYRRNCPARKSHEQDNLGSGNASRVSPKGQGDA